MDILFSYLIFYNYLSTGVYSLFIMVFKKDHGFQEERILNTQRILFEEQILEAITLVPNL